MRIRALLVACLVVIASLTALPADAAGSIHFRKIQYDSPGTDRSNLYWDRGWYVWNNDGDKAVLKNASGTVVDTCRYAGGGTTAYC